MTLYTNPLDSLWTVPLCVRALPTTTLQCASLPKVTAAHCSPAVWPGQSKFLTSSVNFAEKRETGPAKVAKPRMETSELLWHPSK